MTPAPHPASCRCPACRVVSGEPYCTRHPRCMGRADHPDGQCTTLRHLPALFVRVVVDRVKWVLR